MSLNFLTFTPLYLGAPPVCGGNQRLLFYFINVNYILLFQITIIKHFWYWRQGSPSYSIHVNIHCLYVNFLIRSWSIVCFWYRLINNITFSKDRKSSLSDKCKLCGNDHKRLNHVWVLLTDFVKRGCFTVPYPKIGWRATVTSVKSFRFHNFPSSSSFNFCLALNNRVLIVILESPSISTISCGLSPLTV